MEVAFLRLAKAHAEPKKQLDATYARLAESRIYLHAGLDAAREITVPVVPGRADPVWQLFAARFSLGSFPQPEKVAVSAPSLPVGPHLTALELSHTTARLREFV